MDVETGGVPGRDEDSVALTDGPAPFDSGQAVLAATFRAAINTEDQPCVEIGPYRVYLRFAEGDVLSLNVVQTRPAGRGREPVPVTGPVGLFIGHDFVYAHPADRN